MTPEDRCYRSPVGGPHTWLRSVSLLPSVMQCRPPMMRTMKAVSAVVLALSLAGVTYAEDAPTVVELRAAAEQGDSEAQYQLGLLYRTGVGVPQHYPEALRWLEAAVEQGNADAQWVLGIMYRSGLGVEVDNTESARLFRLSAEQGNPTGMLYLGQAYSGYGLYGVEPDDVAAHMWFNVAAALGEDRAARERDDLARLMTLEQIEEAQRMALELWERIEADPSSLGEAQAPVAAQVTSPEYLTTPGGSIIDPADVLHELLVSEFDCDARVVDDWEGWQCSLASVEFSIDGEEAGIRVIALLSPDLSEATGEDSVVDAMGMLLGTLIAFKHVSDDEDTLIDVAIGAKQAEGQIYVMSLENGMFAAMQNREDDSLTVIFRDTEIALEQAKERAETIMGTVPTMADDQ